MHCRIAAMILIFTLSVLPVMADSCTAPAPAGGATPLIDFAPGQTYKGFPGFLYENSNSVPADHDADGKTFAANIHAINGKIVFLSIGMSNTTIEFCGGNAFQNNDPDDPLATSCPLPGSNPPYNQVQSFLGQWVNDTTVNHTTVIPVDGAKGGQTFSDWDPFLANCGSTCWANYDRVRDQILTPAGLSESQVQSLWLKDADANPTVSLPNSNADAFTAEKLMGDIMRAIKIRYPNIQQVFISSRIYAGYANTFGNPLNPEPFAYEYGFSVKWLIQAQINQIRTGTIDPIAGPLGFGQAPWIAWGPYLWANGPNPRSDGLRWLNSDYRANECTHPGLSAEQKAGKLLLQFMKTSPYANWFR